MSVKPKGASANTGMFGSSAAKVVVRFEMAALETLYEVVVGGPDFAAGDVMFRTRPRLDANICPTMTCVQLNVPRRLTSTTRHQVAGSAAENGATSICPALLTSPRHRAGRSPRAHRRLGPSGRRSAPLRASSSANLRPSPRPLPVCRTIGAEGDPCPSATMPVGAARSSLRSVRTGRTTESGRQPDSRSIGTRDLSHSPTESTGLELPSGLDMVRAWSGSFPGTAARGRVAQVVELVVDRIEQVGDVVDHVGTCHQAE